MHPRFFAPYAQSIFLCRDGAVQGAVCSGFLAVSLDDHACFR